MPFFGMSAFSLAISVCFIVHIFKTGRNPLWVWVLILIPVAGAIAYFIVEVMPSLGQSRMLHHARKNLHHTLNPEHELRASADALKVSETVDNLLRHADALKNHQQYDQALAYYQKAQTGIHADDPRISLSCAEVYVAKQDLVQAAAILQTLREQHPKFKPEVVGLMQARLWESLQDARADALYQRLTHQYLGPDAKYYYGLFLKKNGQKTEAMRQFTEIEENANRQGKSYKRLHAEILGLAKKELKTLNA